MRMLASIVVGSALGWCAFSLVLLLLFMSRCRRHLPNGQIATATGDRCIGTAGDAVVLATCDGASAWEAQGNGDILALCRSVLGQCHVVVARPVEVGRGWRFLLEPGWCSSWFGGRCVAWCANLVLVWVVSGCHARNGEAP